ncbi:ATP-binding cassette domain-containing protein [Actinopolymorpha rutila]|uniref:ATP-binding cassette subfamily C protein n=1 Tax=Actinopolymorpha rutila TaxID=446787 RepID=A0A852ZNZ1_9ACTN|nr:ABC transporter ATP-binding protein [Actinopolymorpha rutila]NYH91199.1 ATP-binding cassette subfamily C protein [Actinopolymorpha rutila]
MKRELSFALKGLPRGPMLALAAWSLPEALPTAVSGLAIARSVDTGFRAGNPLVGVAWLAGFMAASVVGAIGSRQVFHHLGALVEPFRDRLVRRVVDDALRRGVAGATDDGAVARLSRQVEIVRDAYAGLIMVLRGFVFTALGVVAGLQTLAPIITLLVVPPFLLGFALFLATLGLSASRHRQAILADERVAAAAGAVLAGVRDLVACGAEDHAASTAARPIAEQAAAEQALAWVSALRTLCFAVGGWLPLVVVLVAAPRLADRGLTVGEIIGGLTYVLFGLQTALRTAMAGLGDSGLRFVVTLARILDVSMPPRPLPHADVPPRGYDLCLQNVTFAYGPHSEPVLRDLSLVIPEGDHLAIIGPSGIGKSTLANLLSGLHRPSSGDILVGGAPVGDIVPDLLPACRVLIPQEAYVFSGTVRANLDYLRPSATTEELDFAARAVGADALIARLGGYAATLVAVDLSAGERQLIALVRAYLSPAPIVVLDEATCHLDPVAERRAEVAFARRGGTLIVIAHRISSALRARRLLVLDGVTATVGDHEQVAATSPLFAELLGLTVARGLSPPQERAGGGTGPAGVGGRHHSGW